MQPTDRILTRGIAGTAVLVAGLACGELASSPAPLIPLCVVPLNVAIVGGSVPEYRWSPACVAEYLEVATPDRQRVMWILRGDPARVGPGVRYGDVAPGFVSEFGPLALVRGERYLVRVGIMIDENSFAIFGEREFVY